MLDWTYGSRWVSVAHCCRCLSLPKAEETACHSDWRRSSIHSDLVARFTALDCTKEAMIYESQRLAYCPECGSDVGSGPLEPAGFARRDRCLQPRLPRQFSTSYEGRVLHATRPTTKLIMFDNIARNRPQDISDPVYPKWLKRAVRAEAICSEYTVPEQNYQPEQPWTSGWH